MIAKILLTAVMALGLGVVAEEIKVAPILQKSLNYSSGKCGNALEMTGASRLVFKPDRINAAGGTIEAIVNLKAAPEKAFVYLFSVGNNAPLWFFGGIENGNLSFMFRKKADGGKYEYYAVLKSPSGIKTGEWTHLAFVWGFKKEKECIMQIYVNGKSVVDKFDQSIGTQWGAADENFCIGCSSAGAAPALNGMIDEFRVSNYPKKPSEIKAAYQEMLSGKPPVVEKGTLLLLHFDGTAEGTASGEAGVIPPEEIAKLSEQVLNEIYPE